MNKYEIAGHIIAIDSENRQLAEECGAFLYQGDKPAETVFAVTPQLFAKECDIWLDAYRGEIESWLLAKSMFAWLITHNAMLLHASAVAMDGAAYLFVAPSGTGKSTHANLWVQHFGPDRVTVLNDDKPLIRLDDKGCFWVCGSPWCGKERKRSKADVPLKALCRLTQGKENAIAPMRPEDAAICLIGQTYLPETPEQLDKGLALIDRLVRDIPIYSLACTISEDAAAMAWAAMKGENAP